jgi:hypothetical protein
VELARDIVFGLCSAFWVFLFFGIIHRAVFGHEAKQNLKTIPYHIGLQSRSNADLKTLLETAALAHSMGGGDIDMSRDTESIARTILQELFERCSRREV